MAKILKLARAYVAAGLSIIPIRGDGSKRPALDSWKPYQERLPDEEEVFRWFGPAAPPRGLAVVCGRVSGNLEVLDFETTRAFDTWAELARDEQPHVLDLAPRVATPGGGIHLYWRWAEIAGNQKLARDAGGDVLIETRGEGGYVLAPGCPPACHPAGAEYEQVRGIPLHGLPELAPTHETASPLVRSAFLELARSLNQYAEPAHDWDRRPGPAAADRPGDRFNREARWEDILTPHGWQAFPRSGGVVYWRRPGKDGPTWSATTGYCRGPGQDLLYVFSSSAAPLEMGKTYSRFAAHALLNHGGDFAAAARALARPAPIPVGAGSSPVSPAAGAEDELLVVCLADVVPEEVPWLWQPWLALGCITILDGDPALGKSLLTIDLATRVSRGLPFPCAGGVEPRQRPAGVLLCNAEDSLAAGIRPRLEAAGADLARVHFADSIRTKGGAAPLMLPADLRLLELACAARDVRLVVIDPLMAYLGADVRTNQDHDVRIALRALRDFAERAGVALLILRHLNKMSGGPALYRGGSSIGIIGAARCGWIVGRDPADETVRVLAMNKSNIGPLPRSLRYRIEPGPQAARIAWLGECDLAPDEILFHGKPDGAGRPQRERQEAEQLLLDLLREGPVACGEILEKAEAKGISERTLRRVKADLGVWSFQIEGGWLWQLPGADQGPEGP